MQDTKLISLYTTDTNQNENAYDKQQNTQVNRIQRSEQANHQEHLEDH